MSVTSLSNLLTRGENIALNSGVFKAVPCNSVGVVKPGRESFVANVDLRVRFNESHYRAWGTQKVCQVAEFKFGGP